MKTIMASARSAILRWILVLLWLPTAGCVCEGGTSTRTVCFSPDGKTVAYVRKSSARGGHGLFLVVGWSSEHIFWYPADSPRKVRKLSLHDRLWAVAWADWSEKEDYETAKALLFSPDSRYLAVATDRRIIVVDRAAGRHWPIEVVPVPNSIHWIGPWELAWCERRPTGYGRRAVWRVLSTHIPPVAEPVQRYRTLGDAKMLVQWSPDGRYVILGSVSFTPSSCVLLDLRTGQPRDLTLPSAAFCGAGWRRDSKAVALFFERLAWEPESSIVLTPSRMRMVSLNLASGRTRRWDLDKGGHLDGIFSYRPAPLWTRDNRHAVLSSASALDYCMLIDPNTGEQASRWPKIHRCPKIEGDGPARVIHPAAAPGWLCFRPRYGLRHTVDYEADRFFPITHYRSFAISPDGRRVAVEADGGKVEVHPLPPAALRSIQQNPPPAGP